MNAMYPMTASSSYSGYSSVAYKQYSTSKVLADVALASFNESSFDGPDQGNLACAYMVNRMVKRATGHTYGADPDTVSSVWQDMLQKGAKHITPGLAEPGDIAFSLSDKALQNIGGGTAHIGIVIKPGIIVSNSSNNRRFNGLDTFESFSKKYQYFDILRLPERGIYA